LSYNLTLRIVLLDIWHEHPAYDTGLETTDNTISEMCRKG